MAEFSAARRRRSVKSVASGRFSKVAIRGKRYAGVDRHSGDRPWRSAAQRSTQIPSVRQDNSRPFLTQKALLNSLHAQQVFDRGYEMCANALFSLSVVLRFIGSEAQAQEVDALVDTQIDQTLEEISQGIAAAPGSRREQRHRNRHRLHQCQDGRCADHLAAGDQVPGDHPRVRRMLAQMDALWLSCVITRQPIRARGLRMEAADSSSGRADPADR
jgi:hypothetical protein